MNIHWIEQRERTERKRKEEEELKRTKINLEDLEQSGKTPKGEIKFEMKGQNLEKGISTIYDSD